MAAVQRADETEVAHACPICFEMFGTDSTIPDRRPVVACENGHSFCATCRRPMSDCPTCRTPVLKATIVNRALIASMQSQLKAPTLTVRHGDPEDGLDNVVNGVESVPFGSDAALSQSTLSEAVRAIFQRRASSAASSTMTTFRHVWQIRGLSVLTQRFTPGQWIQCKHFGAFSIKLYPNGVDAESRGELSLFITCRTEHTVKAKYRFMLVDEHANKLFSEACGLRRFKPPVDRCGIGRFCSAEFASNAFQVPDGRLFVVCEIEAKGATKLTRKEAAQSSAGNLSATNVIGTVTETIVQMPTIGAILGTGVELSHTWCITGSLARRVCGSNNWFVGLVSPFVDSVHFTNDALRDQVSFCLRVRPIVNDTWLGVSLCRKQRNETIVYVEATISLVGERGQTLLSVDLPPHAEKERGIDRLATTRDVKMKYLQGDGSIRVRCDVHVRPFWIRSGVVKAT